MKKVRVKIPSNLWLSFLESLGLGFSLLFQHLKYKCGLNQSQKQVVLEKVRGWFSLPALDYRKFLVYSLIRPSLLLIIGLLMTFGLRTISHNKLKGGEN